MGKISPVSSKYIIHATIVIEGVVDRPDVIGAIFGQTEGLLGADLELRELQRSGRIGRIEVNVDTRSGKTQGSILIPSSLDKAETSIVAASLEIIQRIGPCNARIKINNIEDVRISKRNQVVQRAKELLKLLQTTSMPDSQELADEVAYSVRVMEVQEYGKERLKRARAIIAKVLEDSDAFLAETILKQEDLFGSEVIDEAVRIIEEKHHSNPKRSAAYLISTIKGIGKNKTNINLHD